MVSCSFVFSQHHLETFSEEAAKALELAKTIDPETAPQEDQDISNDENLSGDDSSFIEMDTDTGKDEDNNEDHDKNDKDSDKEQG